MSPTQILKDEHEIVLMVLSAMEKEVKNIIKTGKINAQKLKDFVDFSKNFTDGCHHEKEEKLLFPKMEERGFPADNGPVAVMLHEHTLGRGFTRVINENIMLASEGNKEAIEDIIENCTGYINLLRNHIFKENNVLFPMADDALTGEDQETLNGAFDKLEKEYHKQGIHEKYRKMADRIVEE